MLTVFGQSSFDIFEMQNFAITCALDEQMFSTTDPEVRQKVLTHCIETIKGDTTNRFVKGSKKGRVDRACPVCVCVYRV